MNIVPVSYNINNYNIQKCRKPSFQANTIAELNEVLIRQAKQTGKLDELNLQMKNLTKWGSPNSFISYNLYRDKPSLSLNNPHLSMIFNGSFGVNSKAGLLEQFLSLTESKILKGEENIKKAVKKNKIEALRTIAQDKSSIKRLTGKINPNKEELTAAIEKLSEEQLIDYRFELWKAIDV